jgi:hypothetical protein
MKTALLLVALIPVQNKEDSRDPDVRRVSLDYSSASLSQILEDLRKVTGIPIDMDDAARKQVDPDKVLISVKIADLTLSTSLRLMLTSHQLSIQSIEKKKVLITVQK